MALANETLLGLPVCWVLARRAARWGETNTGGKVILPFLLLGVDGEAVDDTSEAVAFVLVFLLGVNGETNDDGKVILPFFLLGVNGEPADDTSEVVTFALTFLLGEAGAVVVVVVCDASPTLALNFLLGEASAVVVCCEASCNALTLVFLPGEADASGAICSFTLSLSFFVGDDDAPKRSKLGKDFDKMGKTLSALLFSDSSIRKKFELDKDSDESSCRPLHGSCCSPAISCCSIASDTAFALARRLIRACVVEGQDDE